MLLPIKLTLWLQLFVSWQSFIRLTLFFALLQPQLYRQLIFPLIFQFKLKLFIVMAASWLVKFAFLQQLCLHRPIYLNHFVILIFGMMIALSFILELF